MSGEQKASLSHELVSPESITPETDDWLKIEQPPWQDPPAGGFLKWLVDNDMELNLGTLNEYFAKYQSQCDEEGCLEVELQIFKSRPDLDYKLTASYGALSDPFIVTGDHKKSVTVKLQEQYDLQQNVIGPISAVWEGKVFNEFGAQIVPRPTITRIPGTSILDFGMKVWGTLRVDFGERHDTYFLTIIPRPKEDVDSENINSAYESTVTAIYGGKFVEHEVELPDMDGNCLRDGGVTIDPEEPEEPDPDGEKCYERHVLLDPCEHDKIIKEWKVKVPC